MKNFFKKLFGWLFLEEKENKLNQSNKQIKEQPQSSELTQSTQSTPSIPAPVKAKPNISATYKPGQKNNRLHIEYNGASHKNGANGFWQQSFFSRIRNGHGSTPKRKIWMKAESMYNGRIDSMRCTKPYRAMEIVAQIESYCIKRATFKDYRGVEIDILKALKGEIDYAR